MATRTVTVTGRVYWAKVFEQHRDLEGYQGAFKAFNGCSTVDVALDKEEFDKLKAAKSPLQLKTRDGELRVKFKRKFEDPAGEWASGCPKVKTPDGSDWSFEEDGFLPNGSLAEIDVSVYDTKFTPGTRLEEIRVIEIAEDTSGRGKPEVPEGVKSEDIPF